MTILALVERERRHLRRAEVLAGLFAALGATLLVLGAGGVLLGGNRWLALPRALPMAVWLLVAAMVAFVVVTTRRRLAAGASRRAVAESIEGEQGMRRGLLVGALELEGHGALAERAAVAARRNLPDGLPLAPSMRRHSMRRTLAGAGIVAAGTVSLLAAMPVFGDGLLAVLRPVDAYRGSLLAPLRILDAPRELVRGAPLELRVHAPGRRAVYLTVRQTGEAWRTDTLAVRGQDPVAWRLESLRGDIWLAASDGRASSDSVLVRAVDRPFVGNVTLRVDYPAYLARPSESLPVGEPLRLPRGSVLSIAGRASVPLTSVRLTGEGGRAVALAVSGHTFAGRLLATQSGQLRWTASGRAGDVPDLPAPLDLEVLVDSAPRVVIAAPVGDTIIATDDDAALTITAADDHGLAAIVLRSVHLKQGSGAASTASPIAGAAGTSWSGIARVSITALALAPGEAASVRVEAVDASPWAQRGVSRDIVIKRPTMEERRDEVRALGEAAVREARAAATAQKSLAQRTDEAARAQTRAGAARPDERSGAGAPSADDKRAMSFESAEKARGLAQEQRAMTERVDKLREATAQLERQLKAAGALDTSLARQLGEAQAMLRQALTPQLMAQMQQLERAAQQMNGEQSRDALRDLAAMQQKMREQLERSAEMLKRAAHEGAMQTLGDQAKELAQRERQVAESSSTPGGEQREAAESAKLAEQSKRLREQMDALQQRLAKDKADAGASRTEQAQEHAARSESEMRRAGEAMKGEQRAEAREGGAARPSGEAQPNGAERPSGAERARAAAGEMDKAAKSMEDARAAQVKDWKQELTQELDQAAQEMMQLAREERALEQSARSGTPSDEQRGKQSAVEQGVDKANERLQGAAKKSALLSPRSQRAVSDAREKVSQATQQVAQSGGARSRQASALGEAADALTRAAASLARDRERANSAGSASGFSEMLQQMQEMAQKQGQINGQAQSLMSMPGGASGGEGQSLARSLAQRQRGVADQLEEVGDGAGGDRAAQLAREARQLADQLDGGRMDPGTLARQQQLFRRLLDAGRSLEKEEREDSGKREATSAAGNESFAPGARRDAPAATRYRPPTWDELRSLSTEERRAILDYFSRLNSVTPR